MASKFEYKLVYSGLGTGTPVEKYEAQLNEMGKEGWQLVEVIREYAFFMREK